MVKCKNCKNSVRLPDKYDDNCLWCFVFEEYIEKDGAFISCHSYRHKTNADKIRNMGDEELAKFLRESIANTGENMFLCCEYEKTEHCIGHMCTDCGAYFAWLKSEVEK